MNEQSTGNKSLARRFALSAPVAAAAAALALGVAPSAYAAPTPAPAAPAAVTIQTLVDGEDANEVPGVRMRLGSTMDLTFVVQNTGGVALRDVTVTGEHSPAIDCGAGANAIPSLAAGASVTCTAKLAAPAPGSYYTNTATVAATPEGAAQRLTAADGAIAYTPMVLPPAEPATPAPAATTPATKAPQATQTPATTQPPQATTRPSAHQTSATSHATPEPSASGAAPSQAAPAATVAPSATAAPSTTASTGSPEAPATSADSHIVPLANTGGPELAIAGIGALVLAAGTRLLKRRG